MAGAMGADTTPVLETRRLRKNYEAELAPVRALRGVDIAIGSGEFVAVMGPSGCGKSTLLNLIAGLDAPSDGEIVLAGESLIRKDENELARMRREHIGIVFQFFNLLEGMTVLENVTLPAVIAGTPRGAAESRARDLLDLLGIADKVSDVPGVLSGGLRQRLAIARALANEPTILLADEPTGALDSAGGEEVLELLRRLHAGGQTILLVTHDEDVAATADRLVEMRDGRIVADARRQTSPRRRPSPRKPSRWRVDSRPLRAANAAAKLGRARCPRRSRRGHRHSRGGGARRTETAVPRSVAESNFSDVKVQQFGAPTLDYGQVRRTAAGRLRLPRRQLLLHRGTDAGRPLDVGKAGLVASPDPTVGVSRSAPQIVRGRQADPAAIDEAVADEEAAELLGLDVGDTFTARFAAPEQLGEFFAYSGDPTKFPTEGPEVTFTVVGISAVFPTASSNYPEIQLTSAFHRELADEAATIPLLAVYLEHGNADRDRIRTRRSNGWQEARMSVFAERLSSSISCSVAFMSRRARFGCSRRWRQSLRFCSSVRDLRGRPSRSQATTPTLRAIGMTRGQLLATRADSRGWRSASSARCSAVALAVALSPLSPIGSSRPQAEPDPGVSFDWLVVVGGALVLLAVVVVAAAITAWRATGQIGDCRAGRTSGSRPSSIAERLGRRGRLPTAVSGIRMALEPGRGSTAVPTKTTIAGAVIAIAAIAAALTFGASLDRLRRYADALRPDLGRSVR